MTLNNLYYHDKTVEARSGEPYDKKLSCAVWEGGLQGLRRSGARLHYYPWELFLQYLQDFFITLLYF